MRIEKSLFYQRILFIAFWIRATWGFCAEELVPPLDGLKPIVYMAFDAVLVFLGIVMMERKRDKLFAAVFVVVAGITTCYYNGLSVLFYVNGLRDFISYLFVVPIVGYFLRDAERRERFVADFDRQLFWFLVLQVPCMLYQFIMYGAGDAGGGSLGYGNSGIISTLIFVICFYFMKKRMDPERYVASLWENKIYLLLLIPSQLNETKITFLFFPMFFLLLLPLNRKLFLRLLFAIPLMLVLVVLLGMGYMASIGRSEANRMFDLDFMMEVYLYDDGQTAERAEALFDAGMDFAEADIPRFYKILYLSDFDKQYPGHRWTGLGVGQFKGGTMIEATKFYKENEWMLSGTMIYVVQLLIQLGIIRVILSLWFFWLMFSPPEKGLKRDYNIQFFIIFMFVLIMVYNDSIRYCFMMLPIVYVVMESWYSNTPVAEINDGEEEGDAKLIAEGV